MLELVGGPNDDKDPRSHVEPHDMLRRRTMMYIIETWGDLKRHNTHFANAVNEGRAHAIDPSTISRFINDKVKPSAETFTAIADFLTSQGFWPDIYSFAGINQAITQYFHAEPLPDGIVSKYEGRHLYYQRSSRYPGNVVTSELIISQSESPTYLSVQEISEDPGYREEFRGVLFRNGGAEIIMLRQTTLFHPKFMLPANAGGNRTTLPWVAGRLLKTTAYTKKRHQSNWYFRRARQDEEIKAEVMTEQDVCEKDKEAHRQLFDIDQVPDDPTV